VVPNRRRSLRTGAALAGALALTLAATAFALVDVYTNAFSTKGAFKEIKFTGTGPGACERSWSKKRKLINITVKKAPKSCRYSPPVRGSGPRPDHQFQAKARISKRTDTSIRGEAYVAVAVRVGGGNRYELRIFPRETRYELLRQPTGAGFPAQGTSGAIKGMGALNVLRLRAFGNKIKAWANGTELAEVTDGSSADVKGTKIEFSVGNNGDSGKNTVGLFERLELAIPNP
jgi:hypothetical protein